MTNDTMLKANLLGGMNEYVIGLEDEEAYEWWINYVPDEMSEDELMEIAEDNELWCDICKVFGNIVREYGEVE